MLTAPQLIHTGPVKGRLFSWKNKGFPFVKLSNGFSAVSIMENLTRPLWQELTVAKIARWSHLGAGIGFDQLILLGPPKSPDDAFHVACFDAQGQPMPLSEFEASVALAFAFDKGLWVQSSARIDCLDDAKHFICIPSQGVGGPLDLVEQIALPCEPLFFVSEERLRYAGYLPQDKHHLIALSTQQWSIFASENRVIPADMTFFCYKDTKNGLELHLTPQLTGVAHWRRSRQILAYLFKYDPLATKKPFFSICAPGFYRLSAHQDPQTHQLCWVHKNYYRSEGYVSH